jgi:hypothetical protein
MASRRSAKRRGKLRVMQSTQVGDRSSISLRTVAFLAQCCDRHLTQNQGRATGQLSEEYVVAGDAFCHWPSPPVRWGRLKRDWSGELGAHGPSINVAKSPGCHLGRYCAAWCRPAVVGE